MVTPAWDAPAASILEYMADEATPLLAESSTTAPSISRRAVCGQPAQLLDRPVSNVGSATGHEPTAHTATALHVVAASNTDPHIVTLLATVEDHRTDYRRDIDTILAGLQVLPPH